MRTVLTLIVTCFILIGCVLKSNDESDNNSIHYSSGAVSVAGCIQKSEARVLLVNQYSEMLIDSSTIDMQELIDGKSYSVRYTQKIKYNPPIIIVEDYQEASKDYCRNAN